MIKRRHLLINAAGIAGLGALLLASPYFEGSSKIMNFDGYCLRILDRKPDDLIVEVPGRGTIQDFYFDVGQGEKKFSTSFRVYNYVGADNNWKNSAVSAKKYCPSKIDENNLVQFVSSNSKISKLCSYDYYKPGDFIKYLAPEENLIDMQISCSSDSRTPACTMDVLTDKYWNVWISIDKEKLSQWRSVYAIGKKEIEARLEPLPFCPLQVPFL